MLGVIVAIVQAYISWVSLQLQRGHSEGRNGRATGGEAQFRTLPTTGVSRPPPVSRPPTGPLSTPLRVLTAAIRIMGGLFALILVAHVVFTLGDASPSNDVVRLVAGWADNLQLGFRGIFTPADPREAVMINYGLPAAIWFVVTRSYSVKYGGWW
jgi:hypothetical protein